MPCAPLGPVEHCQSQPRTSPCPRFAAGESESRMLSARSLPRALGALGLAGFLLAPAGPAEAGPLASELSRDYVHKTLRRLGLTAGDVSEIALSSEVKSRHNGLTHVYFEQRYR